MNPMRVTVCDVSPICADSWWSLSYSCFWVSSLSRAAEVDCLSFSSLSLKSLFSRSA